MTKPVMKQIKSISCYSVFKLALQNTKNLSELEFQLIWLSS